MKALQTIFTALSIPIALLNSFGIIAAGIWLAILGQWSPILVGIASLFGSTMLLSFAFAPGLLLIFPATKFAEGKIRSGMFVFAFLGSAYTCAIVAIWCIVVMCFFMYRATQGSMAPLLLWSYGVATGPLGYMASRESDNPGSAFIVLFASLAYIVAGLWAFFGSPTVLGVIILFASFMSVGTLILFAVAVAAFEGNREA